MLCPIDGATLVMSERSGVEIDYCPTCRGIWLDRGELDKILERVAAESAPTPDRAYPPPGGDHPAPPGGGHPAPPPYPDAYPRYAQPRGYDGRGYDKHGGYDTHGRRRDNWLRDILG